MLKIQFKDRRKPAMWLVDSTLKLGSDPGNDIIINESLVDPQQAEIITHQNEILLRNLSKKRSIFINDFPIVKEHPLKAWDVIRLGSTELEIIDPLKERAPELNRVKENATIVRPAVSPWMLKANSAPLDGQYFSLANGSVIGREKDADIVVPLSYVSRQHAKIAIRKGKLYIEDLDSSNGTYVNNNKVKTSELRNGDELRFDEFIFSIIGPTDQPENKPRTVLRDNRTSKSDSQIKSSTNSQVKKTVATKPVFLHGLSNDVVGNVFKITDVENHISRLLGHHLSTSEKSVSARHVYLTEHDLGWEIKNNGASDGLLVNGKMQSRVILQDGDELIVGGTILKFQCVGEQPLDYSRQPIIKGGGNKVVIFFVVVLLVAAVVYFSDAIAN